MFVTIAPLAALQRLFVAALAVWLLAVPAAAPDRHFSADDLPRLVRIGDPQLSPDGKQVAVVMARANMNDNRWDGALMLIDVATRTQQVLTRDRRGVSNPRWSPDGRSLAFLAQDASGLAQVHVLALAGGDARQITASPTSVTHLAWRPDGAALAFAAADSEPDRSGEARFEDAFEVGNNAYLDRTARRPTHVWLVTLADGTTKRLTSGARSIPVGLAPGGPPSQLNWTPDGSGILFVQADTAATGDAGSSRLMLVDVASGALQPVLPGMARQSLPQLSPDGRSVAFVSPRGGMAAHQSRVMVAPVAGGAAVDAAPALDVAVDLVGWLADGKSLLLAGTDGTRGGLWLARGGKATRIDLGDLDPVTAAVRGGAITFTATTANHPPELYLLPGINSKPVPLTRVQTVTDGVTLGRQETINWQSDGMTADGV